MPKNHRKKYLVHHLHHLDKRLKFRLRIYFVIAIIMLGIVFYNFIIGKIGLSFSVFGILMGIFVGIISARMYHISWNHNASKVVGRLDLFGIFILVFYIIFELSRERIVSYFVQGPTVGAISFSILAGIMIGRVLGTRGRIIKVLQQQKIFS